METERTVEEMVELVHHIGVLEPELPNTVSELPIPQFVAEKVEAPVYRAKSPSMNPVVILEDCLSPAALLRRALPIKTRLESPKQKHTPPAAAKRRPKPPSPIKRKPPPPPPAKRNATTPTKRKTITPVPVKRKLVPPSPTKKKGAPSLSVKRKAVSPPSPVPPKKRGRPEKVPLALSCELTDWCAALTCSNNRTDQPGLAYFPFPRESERCKQWARNAEREDLANKPSDYLNRNMVLCAKHFDDDQFFNATLRKRLIWDAVPTRFGPLIIPKKRPSVSKAGGNTVAFSKNSPFRRSTAILPAQKVVRKPDYLLPSSPGKASPTKALGLSPPLVVSSGTGALKNTVVVSTSKNSNKATAQLVSPSSFDNDTNHVYVSITPSSSKSKSGSLKASNTRQPVAANAANSNNRSTTGPPRRGRPRKQLRPLPYPPSPPSPPPPSPPKEVPVAAPRALRRILPAPTSQTPSSTTNLVQTMAMKSPVVVPVNIPVVAVASSSSTPVRSPTAAVVPPKPASALPPSRGPVVVYPSQRPYPAKSSEIVALMKNHLKEPFLSLLGLHLRRSMDSRVWTQSAHRLLLILYLHSPSQYQILARMFRLPNRRCLTRWLRKVMTFEPGTQLRHVDLIHQATLNSNSALQLRFQRKSCIVTFRLIAITPQLRYDDKRDIVEGVEDFGRFGRSRYIATHMLIFMAKGLQTNWTLPIGAYPVSSHVPAVIIRDLLLGTLNHVEMLGLHTKVIVCSDTEKNIALFQDLEYTVTKPYVSFRGRRIMVMMDPTHLFRRLRHTLRQYNLQAGSDTACYAHIEKFCELDSKQTHRLAAELTQKDVNTEALSFSAARNVFNASVATGMHAYTSFEQLPLEAAGTANVIHLVSQLMDCFSGRTQRPPAGRPLACVMTETSGHITFLSQLLAGFKGWQFVASPDDNSQTPTDPCLVALYKMVSCLLQLWFELKKFTRNHTLHTARLTTREPRLMKLMRRATKGATDATNKAMPAPTTTMVRQTLTEFSTRMLLASTQHLHKLKSHSLFVELLVDRLKNEIQEKIPQKGRLAPSHQTTLQSVTSSNSTPSAKLKTTRQKDEGSESRHNVAFPPVNTVSYMAGHMAQSLFKDHNSCEICSSQWVQDPAPKTAAVELFALWLGKASGSVEPATQFLVPSGSFVSFVTRCEELFMECFPYVLHMDRVSKRVVCFIRRKIDTEKTFVSCPTIRRGLVRFFVELRIEHAVSMYNAHLAKRKKAPKKPIHIAPL